LLISCWSAKGGCGTTVVSVALALLLARSASAGALLVDLAGDVPAALGVPDPDGAGVLDWLAAGPDTPADALSRLERVAAPGLAVLPRGSGRADQWSTTGAASGRPAGGAVGVATERPGPPAGARSAQPHPVVADRPDVPAGARSTQPHPAFDHGPDVPAGARSGQPHPAFDHRPDVPAGATSGQPHPAFDHRPDVPAGVLAPDPPPDHPAGRPGGRSFVAHRPDLLAGVLAADPRPVVADCGTVGPDDPGDPGLTLAASASVSLLVLRPCFLALRRAAAAPVRPSGVVVVDEPGRSLGRQDVEDVLGVPVRAQVRWDPAVARAVDAGLLAARLPRALARSLRGAA
jgi:hypothetical protein